MQSVSLKLCIAVALCSGLLFAGGANAALLSRLNGQAYYDTDLNITWMADAALATTTQFGVANIGANGVMSQQVAMQWIAAMNNMNYLGFSDWRLPTTGPINGTNYNFTPTTPFSTYDGTLDIGANISAPGTLYAGNKGSEMAYLFYNELGGKAYFSTTGAYPQPGYGLPNSGPFSHVLFSWSQTAYPASISSAFWFDFTSGSQSWNSIYDNNHGSAWAVRTGDVAAVPVPPAAWLLCSGLLGLLGATRRKK